MKPMRISFFESLMPINYTYIQYVDKTADILQ